MILFTKKAPNDNVLACNVFIYHPDVEYLVSQRFTSHTTIPVFYHGCMRENLSDNLDNQMYMIKLSSIDKV